ncbi:MAG: Rrf2 family transcriptional regulator [Gemmatimonadaceae bacterium]|nr:Rrf2 family transcriptional regulator [Gemmatimonadaceae bacterium]
MLVLAQEPETHTVTADEIARRTGAPRNYMAKTLNQLAKAGIVSSSRGPSGGFSLLVAPADLRVATIIDCFDDAPANGHCLLGAGACNPADPCAAHTRWRAIQHIRRAPLTDTTVRDLLGSRIA